MFHLPANVWEAVCKHAAQTYPDECCGVIVERNRTLEVVPVTNVQNELHARDPQTFPRTARTAYSMKYEEVAPLLDAAYRGELRLVAFYHSHPEHDAYFSAEDRAAAEGWLEDPQYARAFQVVLSLRGGKVVDAAAFAWSPETKDFVPVPLAVDETPLSGHG